MTLLVSTALAWTCVEATNLYAYAPSPAIAMTHLRDGWSYTKEELLCMQRGGLPPSEVAKLRPHDATPMHLEAEGPFRTVVLDLGCGSLTVMGHDQTGLVVDGTHDGKPPFLEAIDTTITLRRAVTFQQCTDLVVQAPRDARLLIDHRGTQVRVHGMEGPVEITAPQADVEVVGATEVVEVETMRGDVYVDGATTVQVDSGQGLVAVGATRGATVRLTTVSGAQFVWGGPLRRMEASTVEGDIRSLATLLPEATVDARSQNGDVIIGADPSQLAAIPTPSADGRIALLRSTPKGSLRPDRVLPSGQPPAGAAFERLPVPVRQLWAPPPSRGELYLATGAWARASQGPQHGHVRITADSLTGTATQVALPEHPPRALGGPLVKLASWLPTLASCRDDLAEPVPHSAIDLWATIRYLDGVPQAVSFDADGFDPAIIGCVRDQMMQWTVPDQGELTVDWPLKLRRLRSKPPEP